MSITLKVDSAGFARLRGDMNGFINSFSRAISKDADDAANEITRSMVDEINAQGLIWTGRMMKNASSPEFTNEHGKIRFEWLLPAYAEWQNRTKRSTYWAPTTPEYAMRAGSRYAGNLPILEAWREYHGIPKEELPFVAVTPTYWLDNASEIAKARLEDKLAGRLNIDYSMEKLR